MKSKCLIDMSGASEVTKATGLVQVQVQVGLSGPQRGRGAHLWLRCNVRVLVSPCDEVTCGLMQVSQHHNRLLRYLSDLSATSIQVFPAGRAQLKEAAMTLLRGGAATHHPNFSVFTSHHPQSIKVPESYS